MIQLYYISDYSILFIISLMTFPVSLDIADFNYPVSLDIANNYYLYPISDI